MIHFNLLSTAVVGILKGRPAAYQQRRVQQRRVEATGASSLRGVEHGEIEGDPPVHLGSPCRLDQPYTRQIRPSLPTCTSCPSKRGIEGAQNNAKECVGIWGLYLTGGRSARHACAIISAAVDCICFFTGEEERRRVKF